MWHMTSDKWHLTLDTWHMVWCGEHNEKICWSLDLTVWEWLKSDILHLMHDTWQVLFKCIIYPPRKYITIRLVSKLSIISKTTSILWKLDLQCNLHNFRNFSDTSAFIVIQKYEINWPPLLYNNLHYSLFNSVSQSVSHPFPPNHQHIIWENVHPPSYVTCHVSRVRCDMLGVSCEVAHVRCQF